MKNMRKILCFGALSLLLGGCGAPDKQITSSGGLYEIFVVCPKEKWDGRLGDTIRSILQEPVPMINQLEPIYDLFYVPNYTGLVMRHRNLLTIKTGSDYAEPSMTASYDVDAAPQIIVSVTGPSDSAVVAYMSGHRYELQTIFELAERERAIAQGKKHYERELVELIRRKFDMQMQVPTGYKLRQESPDFLWISYELPLASQGFFIYSYPYTGKADFTVGALLARRNEFAARIPGPSDSSYMATYPDALPDLKHVRIDGRYWAEMRGFWEVHGDFMGGPFISYSTLNLTTNRVTTIDMYVYSPKKPKRNYLRQLENLIYTVSFPDDEAKVKQQAETGK